MLIDRSDKGVFGGSNQIPYNITGGWWTDIVIIAPSQIYWTGDATGEIYHIIICHGLHLLRSKHLISTVEMRVTSSTIVQIASHVTKGWVISHTCGYTFIKTSGDER
jgi:hypothetical protein